MAGECLSAPVYFGTVLLSLVLTCSCVGDTTERYRRCNYNYRSTVLSTFKVCFSIFNL